MTAYYNEIDPAAVAVLRELIARDVIAPGDVDDRSIKEVSPDELSGYTQCHFFAGGGLWSVAARLAGWPDDRELWTGSCPCQPFSAAGKRAGTNDPRHLWPDFHRLIRARRPPVVMGEQVAGAAGYGWFDGVRADLAGEGFSSRPVDIPVCAIDGPHQRNRLYWAAVDNRVGPRLEGHGGHVIGAPQGRSVAGGPTTTADDLVLADADSSSAWRHSGGVSGPQGEGTGFRQEYRHIGDGSRDASGVLQSDANGRGRDRRQEDAQRSQAGRASSERSDGRILADTGRELRGSGPDLSQDGQIRSDTDGRNGSWWSDYEWIVSPLDGKARRTKPGLPFLVDGMVGRADCWRIAGNGIVPPLAAEVIAAFLDAEAMTCSRLSSQQGNCK